MLLVDKPGQHTSHDVIARLRGILRTRKIGHAGTLDPMATGLLIVLVGKATRVSQFIISLDKEYEGTIELGKVTDSQDADGEVMETRPVPALTEADVRAAVQGFLGDQYQMPPMYSAIKIGGVPLYKKARKGEDVEREPRFIRVMSWDVLGFESPQIRLPPALHQGDLRAHAGPRPGREARLRRPPERPSAHGHRQVQRGSQALTLEQIEKLSLPEIQRRLIPVSEAVPSVAL